MPAQIITLFEHQALTYHGAAGFPREPRQLNALLDTIERLNRACGQEILHLGRKELRAGSLVGVLRAGDTTFEILPKLDAPPPERNIAKNTADRRTAIRGLLAMLNTAFDLPLYPMPAAGLDEVTAPWLELLTRMFANELILQAQSGLSQSYATREEPLPMLRGRWDIQRQILQHGASEEKFDSIYDELTADVPLNQVFRSTVDTLLLFSQDARNRSLLGSLRELLQAVKPLSEGHPAMLEQIQFTRLNQRYQPAFQLARMFHAGSILQLSAGKIPAAAFVFDMNLLFERFTAAFLERNRLRIFPEAWKDARLQAQSSGSRYYLARGDGRQQVLLRPDLILWPNNGEKAPLLVADTKYKVVETPSAKASLDPADIYQMLAYTLRLGCPRALLLYPQTAFGKPVRKRLQIETTGTALLAATINLHAPLDPPERLIVELREIFHLAAQE